MRRIGFGSINGGVGFGVSIGNGVVWSAGLFRCDSGGVELDLEGGVLAARDLGSSSSAAERLVGAIVVLLDCI